MRKFAYVFLSLCIQLLSIPFIAFTVMVFVFGILSWKDYSGYYAINFIPIIIFTTIACGFFVHILVQAYMLLKAMYTQSPLNQFIGYVQMIQKSALLFSMSMTLSCPFVYIFVDYDDSPGLLLIYILVMLMGYITYTLFYLIYDYYAFKVNEPIIKD